MASPTPLQAVIFDFDGLILDTEYPEYLAWHTVYQNHGLALPMEAWLENIGRGASTVAFSPYDDLEGRLGRTLDRDAIRAGRRAHFAELMAAEVVRPGVLAWLDAARTRGLKCAVASSSSREWVTGYLARHGLESRFDALRCADDVARTKPDPELYLSALAALDVSANRAIALEDSAHGIAAAKAAGIFCVVVPNRITRALPLHAADLRTESLADLTLEDVILSSWTGRAGP